MTIIKRLLLVLIFCAGVLPVGNQGQASVVNPTVERNGTKEFKESKMKTGPLELRKISLDSDKNIVSYYVDEDGINQKAVYNEKKDMWESSYVKDSVMKKKGKKKYYSVYPIKQGYAEVAPDSSKIIIRNEKGKKRNTMTLSVVKGWKNSYRVQKVLNDGTDYYVMICQNGKKKTLEAVCVSLKTVKVRWVKKGITMDSEVIGGKLYSYSFDGKKVGNPSKKADIVKAYHLKNGKLIQTIDATPIRNLITQLKGENTENAYPITDQPMCIGGYSGKLYVAYMSGIYQYQAGSNKWNCLIDGVNNSQYSLGADMTLIDFLVCSKNKIYVLAAKGNDEGEATDFLRYLVG